MNRKIIGFRSMLGFTQVQMSEQLNVSENTYRKKELGKLPFKDYEMVIFRNLVKENIDPNITVSDIFFDDELQKIQK